MSGITTSDDHVSLLDEREKVAVVHCYSSLRRSGNASQMMQFRGEVSGVLLWRRTLLYYGLEQWQPRESATTKK
jgi:hypothetical protein